MIFKRYLPHSLFGRALLIMLAPVVALQLVVGVLFIRRHYDGVASQMAAAVANELNYAIATVEGAADIVDAQTRLDALSRPLGMELTLTEGDMVPSEALRRFYDITGGAVEETFKADVRRPLAVDLISDDKNVEARILTDKGLLTAIIDRDRMIASNPHQLFVVTTLSALVLMTVAVLFLRNQVRPIRELAAAADAFGKGRPVAFRPAGAEEVRRAGAAFLSMRARIERHVEQRTRMLSGVSHDLRTPLTRMKLAVAMLPPDADEAEDLGRDIRDMERMLDEFLAFARGESGEEPQPVDPVALVEEVAEEARRGGGCVSVVATIDDPDAHQTPMRRIAIKRALSNLVENALVYGARVEISVRATRAFVDMIVEDDGPGIPAAERETALKPFARLDAARNQDRGGGVGLGLSIAADIARAHGGALNLEEGERLGGLRARLRVPR